MRVRLLPVVLLAALLVTGWGLSRHPSVHLALSSAWQRLTGPLTDRAQSPAEARPAWPGRIYYLKPEAGGQGVWAVRPDGSDRERLGGPVPAAIASWAGAREFAVLVDKQGKVWVAGAGYVKQVDTPGLRPETLLVPEQPAQDAAYLYGVARDGDRPVLLRVRPDAVAEVYRGEAPAGWVEVHDPRQFAMVITRPGAWQAVSLRYDTGAVRSAEGQGNVQAIDYGDDGSLLIIHTSAGRYAIDGQAWTLTGSTTAWLAPVGSSALVIRPGQRGPTAAVADPNHLDDLTIWPELTRDLQSMGAGMVQVVDGSRDGLLLAAGQSPSAPNRQLLAAFLREQAIVSLGAYPAGHFYGFTGDDFAVGGRLVGGSDVQAVKLIQPTGAVPLWDQARILDWWRRIYGVVVHIQRGSQSEVGLVTRDGYDILVRAAGPLLVQPGQGAAVVVSGPDAQGGKGLRLVDVMTRAVTPLDPDPAGDVRWAE